MARERKASVAAKTAKEAEVLAYKGRCLPAFDMLIRAAKHAGSGRETIEFRRARGAVTKCLRRQ